jgi:hypothetical protein
MPFVGPASTGKEEPATPLSGDPNLDINCDDAPLRYRSLGSVLGHAGQLAKEAELLLAAGEEPATHEEAQRDPNWKKAMFDEM